MFLDLPRQLQSQEISFSSLLRPTFHQPFAAIGLDAGPIDKSFGIGAPFVVRELVRAGILDSDRISPYCWRPTWRVRKFLQTLGFDTRPDETATADMSRDIHRFVRGQIGDENARFCGDFDLPLQLWTLEQADQSPVGLDMWTGTNKTGEEDEVA
jgi:hypothetical protein